MSAILEALARLEAPILESAPLALLTAWGVLVVFATAVWGRVR